MRNVSATSFTLHSCPSRLSQPTCLVQKCQSLETGFGFLHLINHPMANDPAMIPNAATEATQTSIKQGVKSHRKGLKGPQPSSLPHNGCLKVLSALRYPWPNPEEREWYPVNDPVSKRIFCDDCCGCGDKTCCRPSPKRATASSIGTDIIAVSRT